MMFLRVLQILVLALQVNVLIAQDEIYFPSEKFKQTANIRTGDLFDKAHSDIETFWTDEAKKLCWHRQWDQVLEWNPPHAKWFCGGKINACYNCLDVHLGTVIQNKIAIIWEGEDGETLTLTYEELYREVNKFSNVLKSLGIQKGDRVVIYLPMIPEAAVAMLACARIGAIHMVVFGGFSADALKDRISDAQPKLVITADGAFRRGNTIPLKSTVDVAVEDFPSIKNVVVKRTGQPTEMKAERDFWYHAVMQDVNLYCPAEEMDAEDILFLLYTSGTTGKPKGIIHTTGGYMVGVNATTRWVFDVKDSDIFWCTADIGWITGHSYVIYGPLSNGMTLLIYEGALDWPKRDRTWQLIEKHQVSVLYTAPTAIRTFMKWGEDLLKGYDLSSLRLLGSVGEPINPEAWSWYYQHVGRKNCPIVDTWWQTESGSIMISPLPGITPLKPGSAVKPLPGIEADIINEKGEPCDSGMLVLKAPWPSMLRGIYNNPKGYEEIYWKNWDGRYFYTGDGARRDADGYFWLLGRMDDVINVSGHRLGSVEIESALVDHPSVAEAAVVGFSHPIKGHAIAAFTTLKEGNMPSNELVQTLKQHVVKKIGAIARPEKIIFVRDLPKTRSGKIMRRLLRDIAEERVLGDTTTLLDPSVIEELKSRLEENS